ncbi:outer membrane beta-barrel protein [Pseudoxanthomonas sp.]|uniref:outer membrane beta-barrel protein n=1 Tax=Pseudoxanthomonas sp. TaxID=1871049 RepID=UPI002613ECA6|nr:outer membrane beta-barrel protein [Pseudoxanthomonas sp.]WDS36912.1 MAG: outer membrane beta-barrel protein [Pseudoxanthomonas sp.]
MSDYFKLASGVGLALAATTMPGTLLAGQLNYTLYGGVEHSDNIALTAQDPISESVLVPGMSFSYLQQGADLQANVAGNLEYRNYLSQRFSDQVQLQLAGQANWTILPARLDLEMRDYAGVQPIDRLASTGPDNLQQTNVFTFGPVFHFLLGGATRGQAAVHYISSYAEKTKDFNSHRTQESLGITRDMNATDRLSMTLQVQQVSLTELAATPDYDRRELLAGYVSELSHLQIDLGLGWSQLDFKQTGMPTASGPLQRLTMNYRPTERSTLSLSAAREYSDAAQDMLLQAPTGILEGTGRGVDVGNTTVDAQVYLERRFRLAYTFQGERLTLTAAPLYRRLGYINDPTLDQKTRGAGINISYKLRPTLTLSMVSVYERLAYDTIDRRDNTINYGLDIVKRLNPRWGWRISLLHQQRSSNQAEQDYHENQIYFGILYNR